ncbi:hypothetical protein GPECTOR_68g380 [Gonium pectorale]|uniref:Uncharacterized protein n=1 Tax=Gonium pectorale TaxID=33097 RepID=A0A150G3J9_GONPE|nr:hypothetical protein GPECTOR_68g380 [Gonium pectorale]|eukprot:KXZ44408.1 hypothetical protein GPECTOR_68g380 [Gonium pectorale]
MSLTQPQPTGVLIVLGGAGVGKTAFLRELASRLRAKGAPVASLFSRYSWQPQQRQPPQALQPQNGNSLRDAAGFARALAAAAADAGGWLQAAALRAAVPPDHLANVTAALAQIQADRPTVACPASRSGSCRRPGSPSRRSITVASLLTDTLALLSWVLEALPEAAPRPVLLIDDAHVLREWNSAQQAASHQALWQWLQTVSAGPRGAHVVLASGFGGFLEELQGMAAGLSPIYLSAEVLGELTQPEALQLLQSLAPPEQAARLAENFTAVYEVVGGNPSLLHRCAASFRGDWRKAALAATRDLRRGLRGVLSPTPNDGWARWQLAKALKAVLQGPAEFGPLATALGNNGYWVIRNLVLRDMLALRPYSAWQRDLPADGWGPSDDSLLVVPGSGAAAFGMRQLPMPSDEELRKEEEAAEGRHREYHRHERER